MDANFKDDSNELEVGEIESNSSFEDIYTPLERPTCNVPVVAKPVVESDDNESLVSSDADSSEGAGSHPKIMKKTKPSSKKDEQKTKKNLKIWCNVLEVEMVSNNLTDCNLDEARNRGLLPYTSRKVNFGNKLYRREQHSNLGKRNHNGNAINDKKCLKNSNLNSKRGGSKLISALKGSWNTDEALAKEIADKMSEMKCDLILRAIQIAGKEKIISIFEETREIEKSGGMLVMNGTRRRTSGGVFFYLLKMSEDIPQEQLRQIFEIDKQETAAQKKKVARKIRKQQAAKVKDLKNMLMNVDNVKIA